MAVISTNKDGRLSTHFDSLADIWNTIEAQGWTPKRARASDDTDRSGDFYFFDSLAEATDVYRNHPDRIRQFNNADIKLESIESPGKQIYHDVTGDYVDIGRFMDGDPEDQGNMMLGNPRSTFATINVMVSYVNYTTSEYLVHKQRRILRLVDWLESQGVRTQIVATKVSDVMNFSCVVKQFTDPVNLNDLAVVVHGDFLRRILFLLAEQSSTWESGYGSSVDYDYRMKQYSPEPDDGIYVYVGGYIPADSLEDLDKQFDEVEEQVKKLVEEERTWNDDPIIVYGSSKKRGGGWW